MAGGTGIAFWNEAVVYMRGLLLLSKGRLDGGRHEESKEQGGAAQTRA